MAQTPEDIAREDAEANAKLVAMLATNCGSSEPCCHGVNWLDCPVCKLATERRLSVDRQTPDATFGEVAG